MIVLRSGTVCSVDPDHGTARVLFDDLDDLVSYDLLVVYPFTFKNKDYYLPDIDEHVVCGFLGNGLEQGVIFGSTYSRKDPVPVSDKDVWHKSIPGGFAIEVNRRTREAVFVDSYGSRIVFREGKILIKSSDKTYIDPPEVPIPDHLSRIFD